MSLIQCEMQEQIGTITLDNQARRNAISHALAEEVEAALGYLRQHEARATVLRAPRGCKVWSAGYDIAALPDPRRDPQAWGSALTVMVDALRSFPGPIIALLEGGVWGGACEVAMACDILVATPEVTFAITPAKLGIPYSLSGLLSLVRSVPLPLAKEMLFTARPISAAQALNAGIINHIQPKEEIEAFVYTLAGHIVANAPLSIQVMKEEMRLLASMQAIAGETAEKIESLRRRLYESEDFQEGLRAFQEKRPPVFRGR